MQLFMSGLGYYSRQKSSADKSIAEVFGLQNQGLEDYLGGLLGDGEWVPIDWPDSAEFMYLGPSFRLGYWKQTPDKDGRISLARYGEPSKVYAFYRYYNGQYQQKAIPEWKTQDFSHSYPGSYGEHARIMSALLKSYDMLPPVRVSSAGDLVDIKIGYRLPPSEEDFSNYTAGLYAMIFQLDHHRYLQDGWQRKYTRFLGMCWNRLGIVLRRSNYGKWCKWSPPTATRSSGRLH